MLLVTEVPADRLMRIVALVLRRWSPWSLLTWVWVLLVLHPMIRVWVRCLMEGFPRRIRGCRVFRLQGMVFWFWRRGRAHATVLRIE
jgi:hypothetical protein